MKYCVKIIKNIIGHAERIERADLYESLVLIASNPVERLRAKRGAAERRMMGNGGKLVRQTAQFHSLKIVQEDENEEDSGEICNF